MSSSMSAMSLEDGVMVKISIEPVFSKKSAAAAGESIAGESIEKVMKVVKWIADVDSEIKKMKVFPNEFALSINVLFFLINLMKQWIKSHTTKFMHETFLSWKTYLNETELTLQNNHNSKLDTKLVTSMQKHINSPESSEEKTHHLFKDVLAVDPNLKKEKEIRMMPSDLSLSSSFDVENSCSILRLQQRRKTRLRWSKDLHELFLVALEQLGGPQTATPKRIREVMKVNGLTNDEVKSHLQKYRLHTQKNVDRSPNLYRGVPGEHYATCNHIASRSPESPLELEKVDDELCFKEASADSGKDVQSQALTFLVKGT